MKTFRLTLCLTLLAAGLLGLQATLPAADGPYRQLTDIKVGADGGWDYLAVDSAARRLYVSHATKVVVIDVDKNEVVGEIAPAPGVHGIAIAPELGRAFVSNGRENSASVVDLKTLQITGSVKTGENPDCILYEPGLKEVYTFNGRGNSATVFDAQTDEVRATIPLPGKPESAVLDGKAGRIYNNIEDTNEIVAIDTRTHAIGAKWPIAPGERASGLAIDLDHHRLFTVAGNKLLVALDSATGKVLSTLPIGPGVDAAAYDPGTGEVSRNYMAIHKTTGDVYYLGEDVDIYKNGKIVDHEGAWLHGTAGARLGLLMPGAPVVGQRYYQEVAPQVAMDRAEVVSVTERVTTPAGTFEQCLETDESTPLEPGRESKLYAPGVGLVKDASLVLVSYTKR
jgi:hypothetical protein